MSHDPIAPTPADTTPPSVVVAIDEINARLGWPERQLSPCADHWTPRRAPISGIDVKEDKDNNTVEFSVAGTVVGRGASWTGIGTASVRCLLPHAPGERDWVNGLYGGAAANQFQLHLLVTHGTRSQRYSALTASDLLNVLRICYARLAELTPENATQSANHRTSVDVCAELCRRIEAIASVPATDLAALRGFAVLMRDRGTSTPETVRMLMRPRTQTLAAGELQTGHLLRLGASPSHVRLATVEVVDGRAALTVVIDEAGTPDDKPFMTLADDALVSVSTTAGPAREWADGQVSAA